MPAAEKIFKIFHLDIVHSGVINLKVASVDGYSASLYGANRDGATIFTAWDKSFRERNEGKVFSFVPLTCGILGEQT